MGGEGDESCLRNSFVLDDSSLWNSFVLDDSSLRNSFVVLETVVIHYFWCC